MIQCDTSGRMIQLGSMTLCPQKAGTEHVETVETTGNSRNMSKQSTPRSWSPATAWSYCRFSMFYIKGCQALGRGGAFQLSHVYIALQNMEHAMPPGAKFNNHKMTSNSYDIICSINLETVTSSTKHIFFSIPLYFVFFAQCSALRTAVGYPNRPWRVANCMNRFLSLLEAYHEISQALCFHMSTASNNPTHLNTDPN